MPYLWQNTVHALLSEQDADTRRFLIHAFFLVQDQSLQQCHCCVSDMTSACLSDNSMSKPAPGDFSSAFVTTLLVR